jgi:hypothetical protein
MSVGMSLTTAPAGLAAAIRDRGGVVHDTDLRALRPADHPAGWNPGALVRITDLVPHAPVHLVANTVAVAHAEQDPRMCCGWQPAARGHLLTAGAALRLPGLFCVGCWAAAGIPGLAQRHALLVAGAP